MSGRKTCSALDRLLEGAQLFRREVFPRDRALFAELARGQSPHTLFIACADSRVSPELITQARPGELFVLRNIGNIVPAYDEADGASSVIEYAVAALGVSDIVVCGHTDCGAMKALADPEAAWLGGMPAVRAWLGHATPAEAGADPAALAERNVRLQRARLRTHPSVATALAAGRLVLHAWVYDVRSGEVSVTEDA